MMTAVGADKGITVPGYITRVFYDIKQLVHNLLPIDYLVDL